MEVTCSSKMSKKPELFKVNHQQASRSLHKKHFSFVISCWWQNSKCIHYHDTKIYTFCSSPEEYSKGQHLLNPFLFNLETTINCANWIVQNRNYYFCKWMYLGSFGSKILIILVMCICILHIHFFMFYTKTKLYSVARVQANYTDWTTAACLRSQCFTHIIIFVLHIIFI
jgi:hypothetical protein